jgi:release factor glutamine methyltransferase
MILDHYLKETETVFSHAGIDDARLEADLIWMTSLNIDRAGLYAALGTTVNCSTNKIAKKFIERRLTREPSPYLTGSKEFYSLNLHVTAGVLIPRPETETIVSETIRIIKKMGTSYPTKIADVGCGSGAISIALAVHSPRSVIYASDISQTALQVTAINSKRHGVEARINLLHGDLLYPLPEPVHIIAANLPYIISEEIPGLMPEVRLFEPRKALDGGHDGLDLIKALIEQSPSHLLPGGAIVLEIDPRQQSATYEIAKRDFPHAIIRSVKDMAGDERVMIIES